MKIIILPLTGKTIYIRNTIKHVKRKLVSSDSVAKNSHKNRWRHTHKSHFCRLFFKIHQKHCCKLVLLQPPFKRTPKKKVGGALKGARALNGTNTVFYLDNFSKILTVYLSIYKIYSHFRKLTHIIMRVLINYNKCCIPVC